MAQDIGQIRIGEVTLVQQLTDILHGRRYGLDEVELALEIAPEAVGSQHLQLTEEHEERQTVDEVVGRRHLSKLLHGVVVLIDQFATHLIWILGRSLPEERGKVVVVRTFATTLEVDEIGLLAVSRLLLAVDQHHVTCLEITIEEALCIVGIRQVLGQQTEVSLELQLVEVDLSSLQETVLEVVEVEEHRVAIESGLGIAVGEIETVGTSHLDTRQFTDGTTQQFLLLQRITTTCLTTTSDGVEQRHRTQIGLNVAQLVVADSQNRGDGQLTIGKVSGQIDESMVFITTGTNATHHALALRRGHTIVLAVAASSCQLLHILGFCPTPFLI